MGSPVASGTGLRELLLLLGGLAKRGHPRPRPRNQGPVLRLVGKSTLHTKLAAFSAQIQLILAAFKRSLVVNR